MSLREVVDKLGLQLLTGEGNLDEEVTGGFCSDLLSYVMANSRKGQLWFTIQGHQNIIAVASLVELAGVVVCDGMAVDEETSKKAEEQGVCLLTSDRQIYELAGRLYAFLEE
ncbi:MAG: serine kinase [Halanaerobium sp.]|nr:serine kinase [Halanaerobium sp.]